LRLIDGWSIGPRGLGAAGKGHGENDGQSRARQLGPGFDHWLLLLKTKV
jgi:hypothetical protein